MLAIAYHNLATEEEACKNPEAALQAYLRAFNLISEHNHPQHELCMKFGRAYEEARAVEFLLKSELIKFFLENGETRAEKNHVPRLSAEKIWQVTTSKHYSQETSFIEYCKQSS